MNKYCFILAFFLIPFGVSGQQAGDLADAYKRKSQELLDVFINAHDINGAPSPGDLTQHRIRGVVTELLGVYGKITKRELIKPEDPRRYPDGAAWAEEYIVIQPEVTVCLTDRSQIDSARIRHRKRYTPLNEVVEYPHRNFFQFFMSANYTDFDRLVGCTTYPMQAERNVGGYKTIVADTPFVRMVNNFMAEDRDKRRHQRGKADFLDKKLKLFETQGGQVRTMPVTYMFQYALYIDRIIFDHELESAFVQHSFRNRTSEAHFRREDGQWVLHSEADVFMY